MAGYWNQSRTQLYDLNGEPYIGARAYFTKGGTSTPITVYQDSSLGVPQTNPVVADGFGRFPAVFFDEADDFYNCAVTTAQGVALYSDVSIPIIGPTGGGGGGGTPTDPNSLAQTGDLKARYFDGVIAGWVRLNGRTIGSAISGASERANDDTQLLFLYLWNNDPNLVVPGGRGVSAAADWAANKQMTMPDARGKTVIGFDTMGNTAAGVVAAAITLGLTGGEAAHTLLVSELASHTHTGVTDTAGTHQHNVLGTSTVAGSANVGFRGTGIDAQSPTSSDGAHAHALQINNAGGGGAHNNMQPYIVTTLYMKL